ncbi:MAG: UDP-N-acetylglucosamine 1-carboxyvinyltransferase, partial [Bacteroidaceae bacterium]|nr:UDP-N-acetylglucosamine 1-carboxyvinyltransferase [Bacteroidaceae bacterium]
MSSFRIEGGYRLCGEITPQGAKNEALQVLCAVLLTDQPVHIENIPDIADVNNQIQLLRQIGVKVTQHGKGDFTFQADELDLTYLESDEYLSRSAKLRGSIMFVGPLLARYGKALVSKPGGDKIGRRRVDTHFLGMEKLGAQVTSDLERGFFRIEAQKLHGTWMLLDEASVTGTANIIMAAVLAEGTTTIYNAACEPYIQQLCRMLNRMGARIEGIASNLLTIQGVDRLGGTQHRILPDMIEVGSFIGMAAMCGDGILIKNVNFEDLGIIPYSFQRMGIQVVRMGDDIFVPRHDHYQIESFIDGSFMTF